MVPARTSALQIGMALLVSIVSLWVATQWAAAMLGYQPALGVPLVDLTVIKLYAPWKLFIWWLAFDAQAPDVFARAGALAAFGGLASGAVAIGGAARRTSRRLKPTTYGSARWAEASDVTKADLSLTTASLAPSKGSFPTARSRSTRCARRSVMESFRRPSRRRLMASDRTG
jgi:type IV secretion system protein VirD4